VGQGDLRESNDNSRAGPANESSRATKSVFQYNMNAVCLGSVNAKKQPLTKSSWIFDTGASFYICNDWQMMEDLVWGEDRTTTALNGGIQTGNLFGKVNVVVKCGEGKRIITLNDVMFIPESPCNLVSGGKFYQNGLYLDAQRNVIHNGTDIIGNCPRLRCANVRTLEIDENNDKICWDTRLALEAIKSQETLFGIWHRRLLHTGEEVVIQMLKSMGLEEKKPESWNCKICMLTRAYKQISRETPTRSTETCAELHTDTIPMKLQGLGGFNYCMTVIDAAMMYTWVIFLVQKGDAEQKLHEFIRWLQNQYGKSVKVIMRDGGTEYSLTESKRFAKEFGIDVRESAPRTPE
jgi:hypothetical protein